MRWHHLSVTMALCLGLSASMPTLASTPEYHHFDWQEAAPGVWFGLARADDFQAGNVAIVTLPSGGSMVIDTQDADFIGREILEKAREVGKGPVKYVVDTDLHQDIAGGNIAFVRDNPKVELIAHRNTCTEYPQKTIPRMHARLPGLTERLDELQSKRAHMAPDDEGAAALDHRIKGLQLYLADARNFEWAVPNVCLDLRPGEEKVINDGGRRIEIHYFGRAHTAGDLVVFLPKEKVAIVGDLWGQGSNYKFLNAGLDGRDGSVLETPATLEAVRHLDFDVALTGHSPVVHGKASLDDAITEGEKVIAQIRNAYDRGETVTELLQRMPLPETTQSGTDLPTPTQTFFADVWRTVIINGYEEIQLSRQLGLRLPGAATGQH